MTMYLSGVIPATLELPPTVGYMAAPANGVRRVVGRPFACDNGCFSDVWDSSAWIRWLTRMGDEFGQDDCLFAVVPDVVANPTRTAELFSVWYPTVRGLGFRIAYVLQDGVALTGVPWGDIDAIFVGGSDEWKESVEVQRIVDVANDLGVWTHMGRVNTLRRMRLAVAGGYDSVDGTKLRYGPAAEMPILRAIIRQNDQGALW